MGGCGHIDMVKAPVAAPSVDVNKPDNDDGCTPLWAASMGGHMHMVKAPPADPGIHGPRRFGSRRPTCRRGRWAFLEKISDYREKNNQNANIRLSKKKIKKM